MVFPTRVLIPPARFLPDMMTSFTYTLPFLVGEGSGPMWKKSEWKDVHPDAQTAKLGKLARERLKADAEAARREAVKDKEMEVEMEKGSLQKAKAQALSARPYSSTKPNQHPSQTASLAHNAYPVPASLTDQSTTTMMEQPPSSSSGSGDGKDDDMPPAAAGMMKRTVPAPSVFWTDHLRMI